MARNGAVASSLNLKPFATGITGLTVTDQRDCAFNDFVKFAILSQNIQELKDASLSSVSAMFVAVRVLQADPEALYTKMNEIQADTLKSNNIVSVDYSICFRNL